MQAVLRLDVRLEDVVPRRRGTGHLLRRSGASLARRVSAGGRGAGRVGAVALSGRQGARFASARVAGKLRGGRAIKQARLPRDNAAERGAAILEERSLGGTHKMAAPRGKSDFMESLSSEEFLTEEHRLKEAREQEEEVIIISDDEQEGQENLGLVGSFIHEPDVSFLGKEAGVDGLGESSYERCSSIKSFVGNVRAQEVLLMGEQVDMVDKDGFVVKGSVGGQTGRGLSRVKAKVLLDRWHSGCQEAMAGCDAPRFLGRLSEAAVHQDAGRHAGGQSLPVKARALLVHRKEERVNSGAVYPTTREAGVRCSLGHSAGSILEDEQPSTSWGAGASFDMQEETLLDYEEDEEEQNARVAVPVLQSMVPEVVQGDRSGTRRKITAGYLPRGKLAGISFYGKYFWGYDPVEGEICRRILAGWASGRKRDDCVRGTIVCSSFAAAWSGRVLAVLLPAARAAANLGLVSPGLGRSDPKFAAEKLKIL
ncbi:hypothetical protein NDU88_002383 [Pleurodeles waltl]|uniref:Uncharacterized protein n=1 Tax=Pleurodeles waltl TaxID=8319 RepID=A0AAV7T230_PLEWA|nr:hypothetical protein NDU88_002383 [Pleurodeles waltl]